MVSKRKRPPRLSGGGLGGPKAKRAPSPQRRGPRWSESERGPLASAAGASVVPKRRRPPRLSGGGLGDPKAKKAPSPQRRGSRWSQREGGPLASAEGTLVIPKLQRPPRLSRRGLSGPTAKEAPSLSGGGLGDPKAKEAPPSQRRGPRCSQSERGPLASAAGASVIPKSKGPPRLSLGSYILQIGSAVVGVTGGRNPGGLPLFQFHPSYSDRPPHVGFPAWGARGGLPLFQNLFVFIPKFTLHTSPATWGGSPSFKIEYAAGRGWRPSALSRAQEQ